MWFLEEVNVSSQNQSIADDGRRPSKKNSMKENKKHPYKKVRKK